MLSLNLIPTRNYQGIPFEISLRNVRNGYKRSLNKKAFNRNLETLFQHFSRPFTRELLLQPCWDCLKWENPFEHISNTGFSGQENCSLVAKKIEFPILWSSWIQLNPDTRSISKPGWVAPKPFSQNCLLCKWAHFKIATGARETSFKQESIYPSSNLSFKIPI